MTPVDPSRLGSPRTKPFDRVDALQTFEALSQPGRLAVFVQIVSQGPSGCSVATLGEAVSMTGSALTRHLRALEAAELIVVRLRPRGAREPVFVAGLERCAALAEWFAPYFQRGDWAGSDAAKPLASAFKSYEAT